MLQRQSMTEITLLNLAMYLMHKLMISDSTLKISQFYTLLHTKDTYIFFFTLKKSVGFAAPMLVYSWSIAGHNDYSYLIILTRLGESLC